MTDGKAAWGIDIGQAGLKAVKLRYADAAQQAIAVGFDYIPHPKILSQPDAVPEEIIAEAIETFVSRNEIQGDSIAISLPGQTALARFIQLPPVETSKVSEIVKYEAKQQIPFALEDVIWDYQTIGGGVEESGYMLEAEVGLFAMKRDQVYETLQPYTDARIEVDLIQIAPLALYNYLSYDELGIRPGQEFETDGSHTIILDMGTDNTTLMVSDGQKIWIRNVPIGGNHFTRALTKEMKLTFAKAEHLKCNATKSPDPRAVFQALRPVFNDYVSEIQRSIGYFSSVHRDASITKVIGLGNGFKLAGLQKFLQQNLQYEVERIDNYQGLVGDSVLNAPLFQDNILTFTVPYGLALQSLGLTSIRTTLLPPEIKTARQIRQKKPWAVVSAAVLLLAMASSVALASRSWHTFKPKQWEQPIQLADQVERKLGNDKERYESAVEDNEKTSYKAGQVVLNADARLFWLDLYTAINACLPFDRSNLDENTSVDRMHRIKITSITTQKTSNLNGWFESLTSVMRQYMSPRERRQGPIDSGYVVTVSGLHYHHEESNPTTGVGTNYVVATLLSNLQKPKVIVDGVEVSIGEMGISHATITKEYQQRHFEFKPEKRRMSFDPMATQPDGGRFGVAPPTVTQPEEEQEQEYQRLRETKFEIQFAWTPRTARQRELIKHLNAYLDEMEKNGTEPVFKNAAEYVRTHADAALRESYFEKFVERRKAMEDPIVEEVTEGVETEEVPEN